MSEWWLISYWHLFTISFRFELVAGLAHCLGSFSIMRTIVILVDTVFLNREPAVDGVLRPLGLPRVIHVVVHQLVRHFFLDFMKLISDLNDLSI